MQKFFNKTFYRFVLGFTALVAISILFIAFAGYYDAQEVGSDTDTPLHEGR